MDMVFDFETSGSSPKDKEGETQIIRELTRLRRRVDAVWSAMIPVGDVAVEHPDLAELLEQAAAAVGGDWRRVWCKPSTGFESAMAEVDAILLGGLHGPGFLSSSLGDALSPPFVWSAVSARILTAERVDGDFMHWIDFLEKLAQKALPLLCVTPEISREFLQALCVNDQMETLRVAAVKPMGPLLDVDLRDGEAPTPRHARSLPTATVYSRRDATMIEADVESSLAWPRSTCVWVEVGGSDYVQQRRRLLTVANTMADRCNAAADREAR